MGLRSDSWLFSALGSSLVLIGSFCAFAQNAESRPTFSKLDLEKLRWIEGSWRGSSADGELVFHETYQFADNELVIRSYAQDSTFTKVKRRGRVYFRKGEILHEGEGMLWSATTLNDSQIEFAPKKKAVNSFVWQRLSEDVWLARLILGMEEGKPTEAVFRMERVKR